MITTSAGAVLPDGSFGERSGAERASVRWLIDGERAETAGAVIGVLDLEPGGRVPLHRHPLAESALYGLAGTPTIVTAAGAAGAPAGTLLHAPAGAWHGVHAAGDAGCRLLLVLAGAPDVTAIPWEQPRPGSRLAGPPAAVVHVPAAEEVEMHDPAGGRHHVHARWLVDAERHRAERLIVGECSFGPASLHELHRHPGAAEALYAYEGEGVHLTERGVERQRAGELVYVPAGEWHGLHGPRAGTLRALFVLFGVASFTDAGYELHRGRS